MPTLTKTLLDAKAYKLAGKTEYQGMPVSIETKKGQVRKGTGANGKSWKVIMSFDYGYLLGTKGKDKQHIDCFIGPIKDAKFVYIIHQVKEKDHSVYDEDKCMLGFSSADSALAAYKSAYKDVDLFGAMSVLPIAQFKDKAYATKNNPSKVTAQFDGQYYEFHEKTAMQPMTNLHPPSLKNPKKVKVDNPDEQIKNKKKRKRLLKYALDRQRRQTGKPEVYETTQFVPDQL